MTVTDCNVVLGRISAAHFPAVFGPGGDRPLDPAASHARAEAIVGEIEQATGKRLTVEAVAEGFLDIAVDNMAAAIRKISIARGHDVTRYALACFGGAGGQHACRVADALGMERILIHPLAGVLSAYGIGLADVKAFRERSWLRPLGEPWAEPLAELEEAARSDLVAQGFAREQIVLHRRARLRAPGSDTTIEVELAAPDAMRAAFDALHRRRFGFVDPAEPVVDTLSVEAVAGAARASAAEVPAGPGASPIAAGTWTAYRRDELGAGQAIDGPALILEASSATVVEPGWQAVRADDATLVLTRTVPLARGHAIGTAVDPVRLEIFNNLFMAIAEEMGVALQSTAVSVNIKERLDFSCALFDAGGALIANAPHIPVHLGSMGESIRTIIEARGQARDGRGIRRGDAYALNDPYRGGTHLPDITVIMPVFYGDEDEPSAFVAARGHHADIGGIAPGSMPPDSRTIADEGVLIDNVLLLDEGRLCEAEMRALLASGAAPGAQPRPQHVRPARADRGLRARRRGADGGGERLWRGGRRGLHGPCHGQCRGIGAAADRPARRRRVRLCDGQWRRGPRRDPRRPRGAVGGVRLHRHERAIAQQFQRAARDRPRRLALCRAHADRRRDPDERRLPAPDRDRRPRRVDAQSRIPRRRWSRAMSRRARSSPTPCSPQRAGWRRRRGR